MIEVDNLGKKFNHEWVFKKLTYTFSAGNIYAITGPNGSGKSTLLQILWGQMPPSAGEIKYTGGQGAVSMETVFHHLAIATPYMDLIEEFTLEEQLNFHFRLKKCRPGLTPAMLPEKMNLGHARHKYIGNFSSGMKQRLKLALAFFTEADVLFLDEPGTNLDKPSFEWYREQLDNLSSHCLVFIASNQAEEYPVNSQKIDIMRYK